MKNNSKYFCNKDCEYFPCHKGIDQDAFNCLFCYCPLSPLKQCPGTPEYIDINGKKIKDCSHCVYPHIPEHYDQLIKILTHHLPTEK